MRPASLLVAVLCATVPLAGCQTMRPLDLAQGAPASAVLAPGDQLRLTMRDDRMIDMQLARIEDDTLVSADQRIPMREVRSIERREISGWRTSFLVIGIVVVVLIGGLLFAAAHGPIGIPSGTPH